MRSQTNSQLSQRGFSLIEVMAASMVLSIFIVAIGAFWITADSRANELVMRQKAIFAANGEMERITTLYKRTSFGVLGPATTTGYDGPAGFPSTRLTYPTSLALYTGGPADYITTSASNFQTGDIFQVWVSSQLVPTLNRSFVWIDRGQNVMGRVSWQTASITAASCVVGSNCLCLGFLGTGTGACQKLELMLEYPYRLVGGSPVADANIQSVTLKTIVGRHT